MAVAGGAPEAGLSVGLILLGLACVFLLALNKVWKFTLGALLTTLANMFDSLGFKVPVIHKTVSLGFIGDALKSVDSWVLAAIGTGIEQTEAGMHALLGAMSWVLQETADQLAGLAHDTANAFDYVKRTLVPTLISAALLGPLAAIRLLQSQVGETLKHPTRIVHATTRVIAPGLKALTGRVGALEAKVAALGATVPAAVTSPDITIELPKPAAIPGAITHGLDSLWKRVRGIGKTLTPAGIVGLVAAGVGMLGLGWTRCSNVRRHGENICGMNPDLLESLLADTALILGTVDLVEFAKGMQDVLAEIEKPVAAFWRV